MDTNNLHSHLRTIDYEFDSCHHGSPCQQLPVPMLLHLDREVIFNRIPTTGEDNTTQESRHSVARLSTNNTV